jgi:hypothetical protein
MGAPPLQERFVWESILKGKALVVRMKGRVSEDTNLTQVLNDLMIAGSSAEIIYFDTRGIQQMNSPGVRDWLLFMEKLQLRYSVRFLSIGESLIEQAAITPTVLGKQGTPVDSFDAPYFCPTCNTRKVLFLKTANVLADAPDGSIGAPPVSCEKCGQPLQFDAFEEDFFSFLRHAAYVR